MSNDRIRDEHSPEAREWEQFYRNRWQYDKVVRSTHGVNCTGGCSWMVHVKDGVVGWELQANDYPQFNADIPNHEPRGCPRGISFSWYLYSPLRVKYPYLRGVLLDLWKEARARHDDPVEAWASIVENEETRKAYTSKRGMGGFRRGTWEEVLEIIAASTIYTAKKDGPDRIIGFSPIPAMSMISYAAGTRFLQLLGGGHELLRLVLRPASSLAPNLGRTDRCVRVGRLVQLQLFRAVRFQRPHDPHPGRPLPERGTLSRGQGGGHVSRLQHGHQVRRQLAAGGAGA